MKAGSRFGGHLVQGHIDAVGQLLSVTRTDKARIVRFQAPLGFSRYLIDKGSIAVNGISLTLVEPKNDEFETWIIPHTWESTNLSDLTPGARVNLEFDLIAKYVDKMTQRG